MNKQFDVNGLTLLALSSIDAFSNVRPLAVNSLAKILGVEDQSDKESVQRRIVRATARKKAIAHILKNVEDPADIPKQVALGVLINVQDRRQNKDMLRGIKPNDGAWILQQISNGVARMAVDAAIYRMRFTGDSGLRGLNLNKDDTGLWTGEEDAPNEEMQGSVSDDETKAEARQNPLMEIQDKDTIFAIFDEWFEEFNPFLAGVCSETTIRVNEEWLSMEYGHSAFWSDGKYQVQSITDMLNDRLRTARAERLSQETQKADNIWA